MLQKKRILITGGTGSWANELVNQIIDESFIDEILIYSRGEHKQVEMKRKFSDKLHKLKFMIGDVRDLERLKLATKGIHKVFHMAALKHVPVCEENPWEAVQTNILGTNNVIEAAIQNDIERVVFISTDKAVDPLNLYGVTKSCAEKLIINANNLTTKTDFVCLRAGNVLGTNGSVVPLFIEQIKKTNSITLTLHNMTRFFLRVEDAIKLVLKAEKESVGGEVVVVKMPACKIIDLAQVLIQEFGNAQTKIREIGIRPGEKIEEVLVSRYEGNRVVRKGEWFIILPMNPNQKIDEYYKNVQLEDLKGEYSSTNAEQLTHEGIRKLLQLGGFLENDFKSNLSDLGPDDLLHYFKKEGWLRTQILEINKANIKQISTVIHKVNHCRSCDTPINDFIDFGYMPLAGNFLPHDSKIEQIYPMQVSVCPTCSLVQIPNIIPKETLFNQNYHYFSSVTSTLNQHFEEYAKFLLDLLVNKTEALVLEFGCNDGILLDKLNKNGIKHLGIDASSNVVQAAKSRGLNVINGFFNVEMVETILKTSIKKPNIITGSNVFAHNHDVESILKATTLLLDHQGYFIVEVHYLLSLIESFQFDFFYHEHCNYYSVHSLQYLLQKFGLEIVDVQNIDIHGGSIRVLSQFADFAKPKISVQEFLEKEKQAGIHELDFYTNFAQKVELFKTDIVALLKAKKAEGKRIFAYGASGRAVTLLNYLEVGSDLLDFMVDDSPARAGYWFPGNHLPIYLPTEAPIGDTDVCLITAWSYSEEIMKKMHYYLNGQREFIVPLPTIKIVQ